MIRDERPHFSYSALNQYLRCPLQFYFERVLKIPRPSIPSSMLLGSVIHEALACHHRQLQYGNGMALGALQQEFFEIWFEREKQQQVVYKSGETSRELLDLGVELLKLYVDQPPPENIVSVEQRMVVPLINSHGEYLETPLVAFVDLVVQEEGRLKVTEFKTAARMYSGFDVESSLQATCYVHAVLQQSGELPDVEYAVFVKTKTPKLQRLTTTRTEQDVGRLGDLVQTIERAIALNLFYPNVSQMNCSGCPYRQPCREWTAEETAAGSKEAAVEVYQLGGVGAC